MSMRFVSTEQQSYMPADLVRQVPQRPGPKVDPLMEDAASALSCAAQAFVIVQTGERRLYGNILLKKGIIRPA